MKRQSIHDLITRGIISTDANGLIDEHLARVAIAERVNPNSKTAAAVATPAPTAPAPASPPDTLANPGTITNFHVAKTLREAAQARLAQLELAEREGLLTRTAEVEQAAEKVAALIVQHFAAIPGRIAAEFGTDDAHRRAIRRKVQEELDAVREEMARAAANLEAAP